MITREFKLYLNAGVGVAPVINANQFDQSEEWVFTLLQSDGTVYTPSTGAIIGLKTDGATILKAGTVNSDGQVVITETEQMTAVPGSNLFEILIDGNTHGTANFVVFVERRPGDIDNPSESDISLFQEAIEAAGNVTQFQADISALQSRLATTNANLTSEANTRASADATLQSNISAEASTRSTQDAVLQAEIDQIIAPSGEAPSAAEVQNARIGVDGTTYDTLGNAIRGQVGDLKNAIDDVSKGIITITSGDLIQGSYNIHGDVTTNTARIRTKGWIEITNGETLNFNLGTNASEILVGYFDTSKTWVKESAWIKQNTSITIDMDGYLILVFKNTASTDITPSDFDANVYIDSVMKTEIDNISANVTELSSDISALESTIYGDSGNQYIDPNLFVNDTRYASDGTYTVSASGYFTQAITNLKSGTYYFRNIYTDFSHIVNKSTGTRISLQSLVGGGRVTGNVTIDYDFNLYITGNNSYDTDYYGKVVWSNIPYGYLGNSRIVGVFGIRRNSNQYREELHPIFYVRKDGTGDFATIKEALETAVLYKNAIVDVGSGTFDLIEEFGSDYFANLGAVGNSGLQLFNDVIIRGTSNTLITCHYTGSNSNVNIYFSPFNLSKDNGRLGGFTLENIHLECSNVRYVVHDESNGFSIPYRNQYLNCNLKIDNRNNTNWNSRQCIGGGLGSASEIIIKDCIFESLTNTGASGTGIVSYHNGGTGRSDIIIKDCYFKGKDTVKASWHGASTKVSTMQVSGCSLGMNPYNQAEASGDTVENMELISWNNEVRS